MKASDFQSLLTETEFKTKVIDLAHAHSWLVHHDRPARKSDGAWSTPIEGDPGFPDLVLVRDQSVIIVELKTTKGVLLDTQREWMAALTGDGSGRSPRQSARSWVDGMVGAHDLLIDTWRPENWAFIEETLR